MVSILYINSAIAEVRRTRDSRSYRITVSCLVSVTRSNERLGATRARLVHGEWLVAFTQYIPSPSPARGARQAPRVYSCFFVDRIGLILASVIWWVDRTGWSIASVIWWVDRTGENSSICALRGRGCDMFAFVITNHLPLPGTYVRFCCFPACLSVFCGEILSSLSLG